VQRTLWYKPQLHKYIYLGSALFNKRLIISSFRVVGVSTLLVTAWLPADAVKKAHSCPITKDVNTDSNISVDGCIISASDEEQLIKRLSQHSAVGDLDAAIDLRHTCGYVTMLRTGTRHRRIAATNGASNDVYRGLLGGNDVFDKLSLGEVSLESGGADSASLVSPVDLSAVPVVDKPLLDEAPFTATYGVGFDG